MPRKSAPASTSQAGIYGWVCHFWELVPFLAGFNGANKRKPPSWGFQTNKMTHPARPQFFRRGVVWGSTFNAFLASGALAPEIPSGEVQARGTYSLKTVLWSMIKVPTRLRSRLLMFRVQGTRTVDYTASFDHGTYICGGCFKFL